MVTENQGGERPTVFKKCKGSRITRTGVVQCSYPSGQCILDSMAGDGSYFSGNCPRESLRRMMPRPGETPR